MWVFYMESYFFFLCGLGLCWGKLGREMKLINKLCLFKEIGRDFRVLIELLCWVNLSGLD